MRENRIRFKFSSNIPMRLEGALVAKYGFRYFARKKGEYVIYEKIDQEPKPLDFSDLSEEVVTELTRRVNRITEYFIDPDQHKNVIKMRCNNMARTLEPKQRAWVHDWIKRVIDEEEDNPPWEQKGFC